MQRAQYLLLQEPPSDQKYPEVAKYILSGGVELRYLRSGMIMSDPNPAWHAAEFQHPRCYFTAQPVQQTSPGYESVHLEEPQTRFFLQNDLFCAFGGGGEYAESCRPEAL